MRYFLPAVLLVLVVLLSIELQNARADADHERELRRHVCHEMELVGADADSGLDVEACTFEEVP